MSKWSYRVTQETDPDGSAVLSIRECWIREGAKPPYQDSDYTSWSENPITPVGGTLKELKCELQRMIESCDKAIIDIKPVGGALEELKRELQKMLEACDRAIIDISESKG